MVRIVVSLLLALTVVTCTDAPVAPPESSGGPIVLQPMFSYAGVQQGTPQADALDAAFDRVNALRVLVFTDNPRTLILDIVTGPGLRRAEDRLPGPSEREVSSPPRQPRRPTKRSPGQGPP